MFCHLANKTAKPFSLIGYVIKEDEASEFAQLKSKHNTIFITKATKFGLRGCEQAWITQPKTYSDKNSTEHEKVSDAVDHMSKL